MTIRADLHKVNTIRAEVHNSQGSLLKHSITSYYKVRSAESGLHTSYYIGRPPEGGLHKVSKEGTILSCPKALAGKDPSNPS